MRSALRRRPSPALVVAIIALVVATAGTGYAAVRLPANSVGSAQIKRGAVRSPQVQDSSLMARDFRRGQLPRGARGSQGTTGSQGPAGPQGPKGDTGSVDTSRFYDRGQSDARYAPAGRVAFGSAEWDASSPQTILTIPEFLGLKVETNGDQRVAVQTDPALQNPSSGPFHPICIFEQARAYTAGAQCLNFSGSTGVTIGGGDSNAQIGTGRPWTFALTQADNPAKTVQVTCTFQNDSGYPNYVRCFALSSAASTG